MDILLSVTFWQLNAAVSGRRQTTAMAYRGEQAIAHCRLFVG